MPKGKQIKTIERVLTISKNGRAVVLKRGSKEHTLGAAWIANWPARKLAYEVKAGHLFEHIRRV